MLRAAIAKYTEKKNLLKKANEKLKKAEAVVVKVKEEVISAEQDCKAAKLEVEKYQSIANSCQRKSTKRSQNFNIGSEKIQGTHGTKGTLSSRQSNEPMKRKEPNDPKIHKDLKASKIIKSYFYSSGPRL